MRITLDRSIDAVYIYLSTISNKSVIAKTYLCDPVEVGAEINIDFDTSGRIFGIEVMDASKHLSLEVLQASEIIG